MAKNTQVGAMAEGLPDVERITEAAKDGAAELGELARGADAQIRTFVAEQPLLALGGAVLAGYLVGRLLERR